MVSSVWWAPSDSNRDSTDYESAALTVKLEALYSIDRKSVVQSVLLRVDLL